MPDGNLQDFFQQDTGGGQLFKGNAITIGTGAGAKSIVFTNDVGEVDLAINPSAGTATINLPTAGGTLLMSGQAIQGLGVSTGGNTAGNTGTTIGTMVLAGGNNVTLSQSTAAGSLATVTISAANSATVVSGVGVSTGGNTSGNTGTTNGTIVFAGGNNITLSESTAANAATITISAANSETVVSGIGVSTGGNTLGNTGTTIGTVVFAGIGNISLSQSTAAGSLATITISGAAAAGTGVAGIGVSSGGNTSGNTGTTQGTYVLAGGNNITLSQVTAAGSLATLTISAPNAILGEGVSNVGNTSGNTGTTFGTVVWAGGNNITLSQSTAAGSLATITISSPNMFAAGVSTDGNTAGSTGAVSSQIEFVGLGNVTLSQSTGGASNATITISGGPAFRSWTVPTDNAFTFGSSNGGLSLLPIQVPYIISATKIMFLAHMSGASGSTGAVTWSVGIYTLSGSTASLASSASRQLSWTSGGTSGTATTVSTNYGGNSGTQYRTLSLGTWNITPGEYLFGFYGQSANAGTWTYFGGSTNSIANAQDTNQTNFWLAGFSTSSFATAFPTSINITNTNYVRTGASAFRQPSFFLQGTG